MEKFIPAEGPLSDEQQMQLAMEWAAAAISSRPAEMSVVLAVGPVAIRLNGPLDDPYAKVLPVAPTDGAVMLPTHGAGLLHAAGLLFAAGVYIRDAEREQDRISAGADPLPPLQEPGT